ncbi:hypothetical protein AGR4A_Cc20285 [Agrobacterium tumefaciens str. B6]|uniref:Uncharacterized protein n=1 Tax=Agrobacterium tumefaciens str. B6 TaxID=1183423 RepID=A0A822UX14_AGRTU|nr:hypothetical protein AGR4A_Cc20285 [Agrobacterium tumefaciens str. B6]
MGSKIDGPAFYFVITETHGFSATATARFRRQLKIGLLSAPFFCFLQSPLRRRRKLLGPFGVVRGIVIIRILHEILPMTGY